MHQFTALAELTPEVPVFEDGQVHIKPDLAIAYSLQAEKHGMDGQKVDAREALGRPGCVIFPNGLAIRTDHLYATVGTCSAGLVVDGLHEPLQVFGGDEVVVVQKQSMAAMGLVKGEVCGFRAAQRCLILGCDQASLQMPRQITEVAV